MIYFAVFNWKWHQDWMPWWFSANCLYVLLPLLSFRQLPSQGQEYGRWWCFKGSHCTRLVTGWTICALFIYNYYSSDGTFDSIRKKSREHKIDYGRKTRKVSVCKYVISQLILTKLCAWEKYWWQINSLKGYLFENFTPSTFITYL